MDTRRLKLVIAKDAAELARTAAEWILRQAELAAKARGVVSVALAGGRTPRAIYETLGNSDLADRFPWTQAEFYFGDERAVPIDDPESNYRLARETLFRSHPEALGRVYRMPADAPDPDEAAARYGRRLPDPLDLLLLGIGADGHTASLFPGSEALDEKEALVVAVEGPRPPHRRLTITPPVIERARQTLVVAAGIDKSVMVGRALAGPIDTRAVPAQFARKATWIVDQAAATRVLNP
jgi:6-phosphogluconolactonase